MAETSGSVFNKPTYCGSLVVSAVISLFILFKLLRPYFNIQVICWFCHKPSSVPYGNRNCWDCQFCEQYNGFTKDGGYNKPIPAQYHEDMNYPVNCTEKVSHSDPAAANKLCKTCTHNQTLKVRQLANFTPTNEARFDEEVEVYRDRLERVYRLCFRCQQQVHNELQRQNKLLRPKLMRYMRSSRRIISQMASVRDNEDSTSLAVWLTFSSLRLAGLLVNALSLCVILLPLLGSLQIQVLNTLHYVLQTYQVKVLLAGLLLQLVYCLVLLLIKRCQLRDFMNCILWLLCYGHAVLSQRLLLPTLLSSQVVPGLLLTILLIRTCLKRRRCHTPAADSRSISPSGSNTWSSLVSNQSDSGVSDGHPNIRDAIGEEYEAMDCTASELSSLNIGEASSKSHYTYCRPSTPTAFIRPSVISSSRSSYGGSIRSFRTARSVSNGYSPPSHMARAPSYSSVYPPVNSSPPPAQLGYDGITNHFSTPPSVSNYMSIGSSPDSPTSSLYSLTNQRVPPEKTSLLTQIMLGLSLGVNISIGAFILGRYSVNGDLLSFI